MPISGLYVIPSIKPVVISILFDNHNHFYNNMHMNYQLENLDEIIFSMAALWLTVCIVYCNIWFRTQYLRKQS